MGLRGAQVLVETLDRLGVSYLFGIPGTLTLPVYDALAGRSRPRPIGMRHEQGAGFAAEGYAKVSGRPGVVFTVPGPGATNLATSLASALEDSVPLVAITAQLPSSIRGKSAIHDADIEGILRPVVKRAFCPERPEAIRPALEAAFTWARAGRPGPVLVVVATDLLTAELDPDARPPAYELPPPPPAPDPGAIEEAARLLREARLPVLYAGAGAVAAGAERELQRLAVRLGAPVFTSIQARGVISEEDPLCGGPPTFEGAVETLAEADAALALGTSFSQYTTLGWSLRLPERLIQVDLDPSRIGRVYPVRVPIVGDAKLVLGELLRRLGEEGEGERGPSGEGTFRVRAHRHYYRERLRAFLDKEHKPPFHGLWVVKTIRDHSPPEALFATDSSATEAWLFEGAFPLYRPRSLLLSASYQSMGYALPAALGARLAEPERPAVCVVGDGNMAMASPELASAREAGVDLTVVVLKDGWYNALRIAQERRFGGRYVGTKLENPDFSALARSFGARGVRVEEAEEFAPALERSFREGGVNVVEVPLDPEPLPRLWESAVRRWAREGKS